MLDVKKLDHLFERIRQLEEERREIGERISGLWRDVEALGVSRKAARELYRRLYRLPLDVAREVEQLELQLSHREAA